jgi:hypothetical protein
MTKYFAKGTARREFCPCVVDRMREGNNAHTEFVLVTWKFRMSFTRIYSLCPVLIVVVASDQVRAPCCELDAALRLDSCYVV